MKSSVKVLVVGARCAGAPLAIRLARAGEDVLVIDGAKLPSDQPMSTHYIQPFGVAILDRLGLGDKLRAIAPPVPAFVNGVEDSVARIDMPQEIAGCCPRRGDLDAILVEEARAVGATVQDQSRLVDLLREGDRVVGGIVEHGGERHEVRAEIVVGADGPHSTVARLAGAEEYYDYDNPRAAYWAYWPRPADYHTFEPHRGAAAILHRGDDYYFVFPANRDQLLIGVAFPVADLPAWRGNHKDMLFERVRSFEFTAPLTQGEPLGKVIGLKKARFFFRQAAGPGWALVGDAGLFKDPTPGLGISDAFRDSQACAEAILEGGDAALQRYWRQRDIDSLELYAFARDLGEPGYNNALNRLLFRRVAADEALKEQLRKVLTREISPFEAFRVSQILRWTLGALLRGNFAVLGPFFAAGKLGKQVQKELKYRRQLLDSAPRMLSAPVEA